LEIVFKPLCRDGRHPDAVPMKGVPDIVKEFADEGAGDVGGHGAQTDMMQQLFGIFFHVPVKLMRGHLDRLEKVKNEFLLPEHLGAARAFPFHLEVGAPGMIHGGFLDGVVGKQVMEITEKRRDKHPGTAVAAATVHVHFFTMVQTMGNVVDQLQKKETVLGDLVVKNGKRKVRATLRYSVHKRKIPFFPGGR